MEDKPRRRRKWLWILCGILFGPPLLIVIILSVMIQTHKLRPDQIQAPARLLTVKAAPIAPVAGSKSKPAEFVDYVEQVNGKDAAALYSKWEKALTDADLRKNNPIIGDDPRRAGDPLTADQVRWLTENREMIDDLIRWSALTKKPYMTYEQAAGRDITDLPLFHNYLALQNSVKILSAEARRRIDAGDKSGAADALLAVQPIARSTSEPYIISHLIGIAMQTIADKELASWISDGKLTPDVAARFQGQLAKQAIGVPDYRKAVETEYALTRNFLVKTVNNPMSETIKRGFGTPEDKEAGLGTLFWRHPIDFVGNGVAIALAKANGSTIIDRYDTLWSDILDSVDKNENFTADEQSRKVFNIPYSPKFPVVSVDEMRTRTNVNITVLRLDVAGLNEITGTSTSEKDPFNDEPLRTIDEGGASLIYSLGPDRQDQGGAVSYDPTNGTMSAGDIFIRVPKRR